MLSVRRLGHALVHRLQRMQYYNWNEAPFGICIIVRNFSFSICNDANNATSHVNMSEKHQRL